MVSIAQSRIRVMRVSLAGSPNIEAPLQRESGSASHPDLEALPIDIDAWVDAYGDNINV